MDWHSTPHHLSLVMKVLCKIYVNAAFYGYQEQVHGHYFPFVNGDFKGRATSIGLSLKILKHAKEIISG